jgi:hypothetical protein
MEAYYKDRPRTSESTQAVSQDTANRNTNNGESNSVLTEYDLHRQTLLLRVMDDGWQAELRRYLKDMPADITPDTDIIQWWQVSQTFESLFASF